MFNPNKLWELFLGVLTRGKTRPDSENSAQPVSENGRDLWLRAAEPEESPDDDIYVGLTETERNTLHGLLLFIEEGLLDLDDADDDAGLTVVVADALRECRLDADDYSAEVRERIIEYFFEDEWNMTVENRGTDEEQLVFARKPYEPSDDDKE